MSKIKVIKKNETRESGCQVRTNEVSLKRKSNQRDMVETIENWVADWRRRTEFKLGSRSAN
jgi:hypothetical protein